MKIIPYIAFATVFATFIIYGCKNSEPEVVKSSEKSISGLKIASLSSADVAFDAATGTYTVTVPKGTDPKAIAVDFTLPNGATCSPRPGTVQDFSQPVTYTVTAEDGSTQVFKVVVNTIKSSEAELSNLKIEDINNAVISYDATSRTFDIVVPSLTDVRILRPIFTLSEGAKASPASREMKDFTNPVTYTVTAEDGTTKVFKIIVRKASSKEADMLSFSLKGVPETDYFEIKKSQDPNSNWFQIVADFGTVLSGVIPEITVSEGATVTPASGIPQDFSREQPFTYTVTAEDGVTKKEYKIYFYWERIEYVSYEVNGVPVAPDAKYKNTTALQVYNSYNLSRGEGPQSQFQVTSINLSNNDSYSLTFYIAGETQQPPTAKGAKPNVPLVLPVNLNTYGPSAGGVWTRANAFRGKGGYNYSSHLYDSAGGTLTLTRVDEYYLEGTFEVSVNNYNKETLKFTNGRFKVRREYSQDL